jgi:hypothetical protein
VWIRHFGLIFAGKTFAAAMLAFVLAQWLHMPRPYWAMTIVYVASNPLAGATCSKAIYGFFGTLTGATAAVTLVPNLKRAPYKCQPWVFSGGDESDSATGFLDLNRTKLVARPAPWTGDAPGGRNNQCLKTT